MRVTSRNKPIVKCKRMKNCEGYEYGFVNNIYLCLIKGLKIIHAEICSQHKSIWMDISSLCQPPRNSELSRVRLPPHPTYCNINNLHVKWHMLGFCAPGLCIWPLNLSNLQTKM